MRGSEVRVLSPADCHGQGKARRLLSSGLSTGSQTVESQRRELAAAAEQRGWTVVELYSDNGVSGAKGRDKRPAFDRMCKDAVAGKFDIVAAWSVDRLGRSVLHLVQFVEEGHEPRHPPFGFVER